MLSLKPLEKQNLQLKLWKEQLFPWLWCHVASRTAAASCPTDVCTPSKKKKEKKKLSRTTFESEFRLSSPTCGLRAAGPWRLHCQRCTCCQQGFLTARAGWHEGRQDLHCDAAFLDIFPPMVMMDARAIQRQRSVLLSRIRWFLELILVVVLQSHEISNQIAGDC